MKTLKSNSYATPALEKGLDILELLARQSSGLTKSDIARELNRTVSEVFRMLVCLETRGYISQHDGDKYSLTLHLFRMVQEHPPTERLQAEALPVMHWLAQHAKQSCHMGVVEGWQVVILAQVNSPTNSGFYVKLGSVIDLMEAATGQVILAHQPPERRKQTLAQWQHEMGEDPPADLPMHLARIQKRGYEERVSYQVRGVVNISYPIFGSGGSAVGALTVPYMQRHGDTVEMDEVRSLLQEACSRISLAIGGGGRQLRAEPEVEMKGVRKGRGAKGKASLR
ncbi:IclR family transcriptional regulator [Granulicella arctica]|uniref:DNA-binding IclR family transcriptional regulator n=1 Tax=Granulicella arctica TaxID=940613 RepID=A0A7Y9PGE1_9BACT|nr:IclR family transcriptional regulator [Granulicella arctica]NYF78681.1 DNA-binding IclR family transcriptional regulator [Granulicella arctica]